MNQGFAKTSGTAGWAEGQSSAAENLGKYQRVALLAMLGGLLVAGLYLRLTYALTTSPYIDEYTTMWVALRTVEHGYPVFSTGAIYSQGLLFTYLDALFFWLFSFSEVAARIPSVIIGVLTILSVYLVGKKMFSAHQGLIAAAILAFAPQAVLWGGRARNYALIQLLVLWAAYLFYKWAILGEGDRFGWLFVLAFGAAVHTHNVAMLLYPPFIICAFLARGWRWFFNRKVIAANVLVFIAMVGSLFLYRRMQPPGWGEVGEGRLEVGFSLNLPGAIQRYKPFFLGLDDLPFAAILTLLCAMGVAYLLFRATRARSFASTLSTSDDLAPLAYLGLFFLLVVLEMFFVVNERRWSPRYFFLEAPIFYLIAVNVLSRIAGWADRRLRGRGSLDLADRSRWRGPVVLAVTALSVCVISALSWPAARAGIAKGEYGYDQAFLYVQDHRWVGDTVMSFAVSPCVLYLGEDGCDYVAIEKDFHSYAIQQDGVWLEAWGGLPIVFTDGELTEVIESSPRTWFVVDESRFRTRYTPYFIQYVWDRMELVAKESGVFVFLSESPAPPPLAIQRSLYYNLGDQVVLLGYGLSETEAAPGDVLELSLRWQALTHILDSYSVFVHLVDREGRMWAQDDGAPLRGMQPTTHLVESEIISDPRRLALPVDIPPGRYLIQTGMYLPATMERLPVLSREKELPGDAATLDYVQVGGRPGEDHSPQHEVSFNLGGLASLLGYDLEVREPRRGGQLRVVLYWRADQRIEDDYTVFVHLVDQEGRIWGQQDNQPDRGFYPTPFWDVGELVRDEYEFVIDKAAPRGEYRLEVGMYVLDTGQRLRVMEDGAETGGDSIVLAPLVLD